jgi:hypothetical protein
MTSLHTSLSATLAAALLGTLAACGGAAQSQPTSPTGSGPVVVAPPAGDAAGSAAAAPKITKPGPNVTPDGVVFNFKTDIQRAQVYLAGTFNNWTADDGQYRMKDDDGDGVYSITVKLAPGSYQYKYVVDGKWTQDQHAPGEAPDGYGGRNSQFDVK